MGWTWRKEIVLGRKLSNQIKSEKKTKVNFMSTLNVEPQGLGQTYIRFNET